MKKNSWKTISISVLLIISGAAGFLGYQAYQLNKTRIALEADLSLTRENLATTTKDLGDKISSLEQDLSNTKAERDDFELKYIEEKKRLDDLSYQIQGIQGAVGILEKLRQTDPELLKKYSKVYFLNENYVPEMFVRIDSKYTYDTKDDYLIYERIWPFLEKLMIAAEGAGIDIKIISAYRSFGKQSELKSSYTFVYGTGANKFSADQGYSEHQLGTTVDFTDSKTGASFSGFEKTAAYKWLIENAYNYGFILSYPENNNYYQFEPWHWRFVGRSLADRLNREGKHFYDLDQRDIDQYLISFFD